MAKGGKPQISAGCGNGKAPPEEGALNKERVMMKLLIIVVLLVISFPAY